MIFGKRLIQLSTIACLFIILSFVFYQKVSSEDHNSKLSYLGQQATFNIEGNNFKIAFEDIGVNLFVEEKKELDPTHPESFFLKPEKKIVYSLNEQKLEEFFEFLNRSFGEDPRNANFVLAQDGLKVTLEDEGLIVDKIGFKKQLDERIPAGVFSFTPTFKKGEPQITSQKLLFVQNKAQRIVQSSLTLKQKDENFNLDSAALFGFLKITPQANSIEIDLDSDKLKSFIGSLKTRIETNDIYLDQEKSLNSIKNNLLSRAAGQVLSEVNLVVEEKPSTSGELEEKYLEVDLSQQKLYQWEANSLIGSYPVSTGRRGADTPTGFFKTLNKAPLAWSDVSNVWMPYWMAFTHHNGHYLGLHEMPYRKNEDGTLNRLDITTLGTPASGGCIRLGQGAAKKIYDWTEVGTLVYVHD